MLVEILQKRHNCKIFDCGEESLNEYLRRYARQNNERGIGRTFVAVEISGSSEICGYFTLSARTLQRQQLPDARGLPAYPLPVAVLGRLAVDRRCQGRRLGEQLLMAALRRCADAADRIGIYAVVVDALDERAKAFYQKYGFQEVLDDPLHLFLPIPAVRSLLPESGGG